MLMAVSSCYIPDKFNSELRISRYGDYSLTYKGDLLWGPILGEYRQGNINAENEPAKIANILKDLSRDGAIRKIESLGRGRFAVEYERSGRLERVQLIALEPAAVRTAPEARQFMMNLNLAANFKAGDIFHRPGLILFAAPRHGSDHESQCLGVARRPFHVAQIEVPLLLDHQSLLEKFADLPGDESGVAGTHQCLGGRSRLAGEDGSAAFL